MESKQEPTPIEEYNMFMNMCQSRYADADLLPNVHFFQDKIQELPDQEPLKSPDQIKADAVKQRLRKKLEERKLNNK